MRQTKYGRGTVRPAPMPVDELRQFLDYNPKTGILRWGDCPLGGQGSRRVRRGAEAGCHSKHGYIVIRLNKVLYPAHRLAWYLQTGDWPTDEIDHINEIKSDNRFENLRAATPAENVRYRHQNRIKREAKPDYVPSDLKDYLAQNDRLHPAQIREILSYDPNTGLLRWKEDRGCNFNKRPAGTPAGSLKTEGYVCVRIGKTIYKAHRLAWVIVTGEWPERLIDHINGIKSDNRWVNLRLASPSQNMHALSGRGTKSGFRGVYTTKYGFYAKLMVNRKVIQFPTRATAEEAYADYCAAARRYHGEFARVD